MATLVLFNKPFQVLTQFTDDNNRTTLANYVSIKNVYPAGRLDYDSEGLLLLTDDGNLQHSISHPNKKMAKTYWVQVEGLVSDESIAKLESGVELKDGLTKPAKAKRIDEPAVWARTPPIRERKAIPTTWLELTIWEGKNRQVRRMTAAVGNPTLRLIRAKIGEWELSDLQPGEYRTLEAEAPPAKPKRHSSRDSKSRYSKNSKGTNSNGSKSSHSKSTHNKGSKNNQNRRTGASPSSKTSRSKASKRFRD